jgi:hypothetical protein
MSIIDTTITRIQVLADACIGIKAAPAYPTEDAGVLPMSIAYIASGNVTQMNATDTKLIVNINVDFHFMRDTMRLTYTAIDAVIPDFIQRLGGDPTLASSVSTIIFPVAFSVGPVEWNKIVTQAVSFTIPVKFNLLTPTVTP